MRSLIEIEDIVELAPRVIWFEAREQALKDPIRFIAYALRYASHEDMTTIRKHITDEYLVVVLDNLPPGIVDRRSWAYWNAVVNRYPAPPMPTRKIY